MDEAQLQAARAALEERRQSIVQRNREKLVEMTTEESDGRGDSIDHAVTEQTDGTDLGLQGRLARMLKEIEEAERRIDAGEYGDCEECGDPIAPARLRAHPEARYCVDCLEEIERDQKSRYKRPGLIDEYM